MDETPDKPMPLEAIVEELLRATVLLRRRLRAEANPTELTWSQISAMARLAHTGWMTTADLARAEAVKPQSMGATLASLEQEGLVRRRPDPSDGRQVLFGLTELGSETRQHNMFLKRRWLVSAMAKLNPAEHQTLVAASALIQRLGAS